MDAVFIATGILSSIEAIILYRIVDTVLKYGEFKEAKRMKSFLGLSGFLFGAMLGIAAIFTIPGVCACIVKLIT
jgi:hypothetical protein